MFIGTVILTVGQQFPAMVGGVYTSCSRAPDIFDDGDGVLDAFIFDTEHQGCTFLFQKAAHRGKLGDKEGVLV